MSDVCGARKHDQWRTVHTCVRPAGHDKIVSIGEGDWSVDLNNAERELAHLHETAAGFLFVDGLPPIESIRSPRPSPPEQ